MNTDKEKKKNMLPVKIPTPMYLRRLIATRIARSAFSPRTIRENHPLDIHAAEMTAKAKGP